MPTPDCHPGRIVAVDVGDARIGVAMSDETRLLATPVGIIERAAGSPAQQAADAIALHSAQVLVVGLPRNMDGSTGPQAAKVKRFADQVAALCERVEIVFWDERLSTVEAHAIRQRAGAGRKQRRKPVDAVSAAVILQSYLDFLRARDTV